LIDSMVPPGEPVPRPIAWAEVGERVLVPRWHGLQRRTAGCTGGVTVARLPATATGAAQLGGCAARALGGDADPGVDGARSLAIEVLGAGLALALRGTGWVVEKTPGVEVTMRCGEVALRPFIEVARMVDGRTDAGGWLAQCQRLGIPDLPLRAPYGVGPLVQAPEPALPRRWSLITRSCTRGWTHWRWGELWMSSGGLLRRELGWGETIVRSTGPGRTVDGTESLWLTDADARQVGAENSGNTWVAREAIRRARLRRGILTGRLRLELADGSRIRWLFHVRDRADRPLREWLGDLLAR
jgi:hypothetical protein